jgi:hypothetical protein
MNYNDILKSLGLSIIPIFFSGLAPLPLIPEDKRIPLILIALVLALITVFFTLLVFFVIKLMKIEINNFAGLLTSIGTAIGVFIFEYFVIENLPEDIRFFAVIIGMLIAFVLFIVFLLLGILYNLIDTGIIRRGDNDEIIFSTDNPGVRTKFDSKKLKFIKLK